MFRPSLLTLSLSLCVGSLCVGLAPWAAVAQSSNVSSPSNPPSNSSETSAPILSAEDQSLVVHLVVKLKKRRVYVYEGEKVVASYPIAIGRSGWETPIGEHHVINKEVNPVFKSFKTGKLTQPGPDNPLGVRWIGIWTDGKTQLGFHGTNEPDSVGQAVSHGCMRMLNKDVTKLFEQVAIGTPVSVQP